VAQLKRICIVLEHKYGANAMQIRCKYGCKCMMHKRCKFNSNLMQTENAKRCKCDATLICKCGTFESNLHRLGTYIRCKYDANKMQMRCKYGCKCMMHKRCKFNSNTMQIENAKRCKCDATLICKCGTIESNLHRLGHKYGANTMQIRCKCDANAMQMHDA
jgi:hypothetical protein